MREALSSQTRSRSRVIGMVEERPRGGGPGDRTAGFGSERYQLVDAIRGVAIIGVVFGHVLRGLFAADIVDPSIPFFSSLDRTLHLVRMPLFALLAGTLIPGSVTRRGARAFIATRSELIAYQFLVWTLIQGTIEVVASNYKSLPVTWSEAFNLLYPLSPLWFLPFMMLASAVTAVVQPWRSAGRLVFGIASMGALSLLTWSALPEVIFLAGLPLIIFVVIGAAVRVGPAVRFIGSVASRWLAVMAVAGGAVTLGLGFGLNPSAPTGLPSERSVEGVVLGVIGTVAGVIAAIALISLVVRVTPTIETLLSFFGRHSIHIFLSHIIFTAGTRIALMLMGVQSSVIHLAVGLLIGVAGPLVVERLARSYAPWLFSPPWRKASK